MWAAALLVLLVALGLGAAAAAWWALQATGRTPVEAIRHAKVRLQGHPSLEAVALPLLNGLARTLGTPDDELEERLPFVVPPLPPNPAARPPALPGGDDPPGVLRVGPGRALTRIAQAIAQAPDGAVIEIDPGDYEGDVAVIGQRALTLRGTGDWVRLIARGMSAEGKAIWVVRGGQVTVEGVQFIGARVPDGNGAGIRLERGQLTVRRCAFLRNENGILTANEPGTRLAVEDSEFGYNGAGDGRSHGLYVGRIDALQVTGSYFHHGNVGHLLKSRARRNRIEYNRLTDESGGRASYELELPDGGEAEVVGNVIQQDAGTRNSVIVSYGTEGLTWPANTLLMAFNTVVNDAPHGGSFLRVAPGGAAVVLRNNLWVGEGRIDAPAADAAGDQAADWRWFTRPAAYDYRLSAVGRQAARAPAAGPEPGLPAAEFAPPAGRHALAGPPRWPGALQSAGP